MVNEAIAVGVGIAEGTMVSYIIEFLIGIGLVYLTVLGAVKLWDVVYTSWEALRLDVKLAKENKTSVLQVWKDRVRITRHAKKQA
jgi:hypothetical protein